MRLIMNQDPSKLSIDKKSSIDYIQSQILFTSEMTEGSPRHTLGSFESMEKVRNRRPFFHKQMKLKIPNFEKMSPEERNSHLKTLISPNKVIVFADDGKTTVDGLPNFSILFGDLKEIFSDKKADQKSVRQAKIIRKPKLDMGLPSITKKDEEEQYGQSASQDPKRFKGNIDLQQHLNRVYHNKSKIKFEKSLSVRKQKVDRRTATDDMNINLPEDEIKRAA